MGERERLDSPAKKAKKSSKKKAKEGSKGLENGN